jgi:hypothetical protein
VSKTRVQARIQVQRVRVKRDPRNAAYWWVDCDACGPNPGGLLPIRRKKDAQGMAWLHRTSHRPTHQRRGHR